MGIAKYINMFKQCSPAAEYLDFPLYFPPPIRRSRKASASSTEASEQSTDVGASPLPPVSEDKLKVVWNKFSNVTPCAQKCAYVAREMKYAPSQKDVAELHAAHGGADIPYEEFRRWLAKINKEQQTDSVEGLLDAFKEYDSMGTGQLPVQTVRNILTNYGEALTPQEADAIFAELGISGTRVDYRDFVEKLLAGE